MSRRDLNPSMQLWLWLEIWILACSYDYGFRLMIEAKKQTFKQTKLEASIENQRRKAKE